MNTHEMRLHPLPFSLIRDGKKTVEIRLNDEKRKLMRLGDRIVFSLRTDEKEQIEVKIIGLDQFSSFKEAYASYPPAAYGGESEEEWELMYTYYAPEEETEHGVLGIRIALV